MRLTTRLLLGALVIVGVLDALVVGTVDARLRNEVADEEVARLARDADFVATLWTAGLDARALADAAGARLGVHVTLIGRDGVRVSESRAPSGRQPDAENLGNRPEVAQALAGTAGRARRAEQPDARERLYIAMPASRGAVRLDRPLDELMAPLARARRDIYAAGVLVFLAALAATWVFATGLVAPLLRLRDVARGLAAGDLSRRPSLSEPGEIGELASALHRLAEQLGARIDALSAEDALVNATLESLNEGVLAIDARHRVIRINATGRRLLGVRDEIPFPIDHLPRERVLREALTAALGRVDTNAVETTIGDRILTLTARPLAGGGAVIAVFDLTALRRLELVRRDFVANVSHELKTPLTVIGGFAETLLDPDIPAARRQQFAETIRTHAQRMQRVVDDLLDLSRIESGGWVPNAAWVDVRALVPEATAAAAAVAARRHVVLDVAIDSGAERVYADATALRQIIGNLADNAARHTEAGTVTVFTEASDSGTWIGVRDTGSGIRAEHLPRIFERFYRVDPGRSRDVGGTGLGLAIVRHLVEAHGGRVHADSTPGAGTTIAAFFPEPAAS